jgi:hypothetical protein
MKRMSNLRYLIIVVVLGCSGCLLNHSQKRVIREDERRMHVHFESPSAAESFNKVANSEDMRKANGSSSSFGIPFVVGLSHEAVPSQNAFYNDQVTRCDANSDGFISNEEAQSFSIARTLVSSD